MTQIPKATEAIRRYESSVVESRHVNERIKPVVRTPLAEALAELAENQPADDEERAKLQESLVDDEVFAEHSRVTWAAAFKARRAQGAGFLH